MVCVRAMQESRGYPLRPAHARRLRLRAETAVEGRPSTLATLLPGDAVRTTAFQKHIWGQLRESDTAFLTYVLDILIPVASETPDKGRVVSNIVTSVPSYTLWTKMFAKLRKVAVFLQNFPTV